MTKCNSSGQPFFMISVVSPLMRFPKPYETISVGEAVTVIFKMALVDYCIFLLISEVDV